METITKIASKNYRLDITGQQLTFLDSRFYYTEAGQFVPSVSTICEAYPKGYGFYKWLKEVGEDSDTIRDEAGYLQSSGSPLPSHPSKRRASRDSSNSSRDCSVDYSSRHRSAETLRARRSVKVRARSFVHTRNNSTL